MNPDNDSSHDDDDHQFTADFLAPLRQIAPDRNTVVRLRAAVDAELRQTRPVTQHTPWWRRSVAVPLPVLIAASLLFAVVLAQSAFRSADQQSATAAVSHKQPLKPAAAAQHPKDVPRGTPDGGRQSSSDEPLITTHETYLCGLGRIDLTTTYTFQETSQ